MRYASWADVRPRRRAAADRFPCARSIAVLAQERTSLRCAPSSTAEATNGKRSNCARWGQLGTGEPYHPQIDVKFRAAVRGRLAASGASLVTVELLSASTVDSEPGEDEALVYANRAWHGLRPLADAVRTPLLLWPSDSATF